MAKKQIKVTELELASFNDMISFRTGIEVLVKRMGEYHKDYWNGIRDKYPLDEKKTYRIDPKTGIVEPIF